MAELQSSLPLVELGSGDQIVIEAIDPTTGAQVAGVSFSGVAITYEPDTGGGADVPLPAALAYSPTGTV